MTSGHGVPQVQRCSHPGCHSGANSIRGDHAHCCTFVEIALRLGPDPAKLAGACHRCDCRVDDMFTCPASSLGRVPTPRGPSD
ncbi:MAG TPA: DUF1540 domain-containing protein [Pseudonocardia sp.]|jgi:hypothetical protein|nr:DUF1540 domain-containing protein [Pseudonocardia sp.]